MTKKTAEERTQWVYNEQTFPVWNRMFAKAERTEMIRDDLMAGRKIAIMLAVLIGIGLSLSLLTVAFLMNWRGFSPWSQSRKRRPAALFGRTFSGLLGPLRLPLLLSINIFKGNSSLFYNLSCPIIA